MTSITLFQLTRAIGATLTERFKGALWVVAEVSECKLNSSSGHFYLSLVERQEGSNQPVAELRAAIWAQNYRRIAEKFYSIAGCKIEPGMKLLFNCSVSYHSNYGLSLVISDIDPTYTLGEGERMRQLTIAKLQSQGVWNLQREQNTMPRVIQRLAVISSSTAAGFEDFMKQLDGSKYRFEVDLYEAMMQGEQTEPSIIKALERILNSEREYDSVVIIRGGGSASDLRWFDSYELSFYVAQFPMPILTGIGHEKDTSVVDMVAFHSFKTPTAVASILIERIAALDKQMENLMGEVLWLAQQKLMFESQRVTEVSHSLRAKTVEILQSSALELESLSNRLPALSRAIIERQESRLALARSSVEQLATNIITKQLGRMEVASRVIPQIASGIVSREFSRVANLRGLFLRSAQQTIYSNQQRVNSASYSLRSVTSGKLQQRAIELQQISGRVVHSANTVMQRENYRVANLNSYLKQRGEYLVSTKFSELDNLRRQFYGQSTAIVQKESYRVANIDNYLKQQGGYLVATKSSQLQNLTERFLRQSDAILQSELSRLNLIEERVNANNPRRILDRGYSLTYNSRGELVKGVAQLTSGDRLKLELRDGAVTTIVE